MTFDEILQAQGLNDEQIQKIKGEMKTNKVYTAGEENLDIRYQKLKADHEGVNGQLAEAQKLIDEMKKSEGTSEKLKGQISEYEQRIQQLETEKQQLATEAALKVALLEANAEDIDYLTYKVKEKGEVQIGEDGKIKGIEDTIAALKTQFPTQFKGEAGRKYEEHKLPGGDEGKKGVTPEQFAKMGYNQRNELFQKDPDLYHELSKGD